MERVLFPLLLLLAVALILTVHRVVPLMPLSRCTVHVMTGKEVHGRIAPRLRGLIPLVNAAVALEKFQSRIFTALSKFYRRTLCANLLGSLDFAVLGACCLTSFIPVCELQRQGWFCDCCFLFSNSISTLVRRFCQNVSSAGSFTNSLINTARMG